MSQTDYDFVVVGGGPSGATAANDLAREAGAFCYSTVKVDPNLAAAPFHPG